MSYNTGIWTRNDQSPIVMSTWLWVSNCQAGGAALELVSACWHYPCPWNTTKYIVSSLTIAELTYFASFPLLLWSAITIIVHGHCCWCHTNFNFGSCSATTYWFLESFAHMYQKNEKFREGWFRRVWTHPNPSRKIGTYLNYKPNFAFSSGWGLNFGLDFGYVQRSSGSSLGSEPDCGSTTTPVYFAVVQNSPWFSFTNKFLLLKLLWDIHLYLLTS